MLYKNFAENKRNVENVEMQPLQNVTCSSLFYL